MPIKAISAKREQNVTETHGSPRFDVLVKILGAWPFNARPSEHALTDCRAYGRCIKPVGTHKGLEKRYTGHSKRQTRLCSSYP